MLSFLLVIMIPGSRNPILPPEIHKTHLLMLSSEGIPIHPTKQALIHPGKEIVDIGYTFYFVSPS
jgi:hypothetical protein